MRYSGNQGEPMRNKYKQQMHWQNLYLFHNKSWEHSPQLHKVLTMTRLHPVEPGKKNGPPQAVDPLKWWAFLMQWAP